VKGFGPHVQQTDRIRYRHELDRETFLQILGFRVVSIPYDNLESEPMLSINLLRLSSAQLLLRNVCSGNIDV
jgi:hypothetical protein